MQKPPGLDLIRDLDWQIEPGLEEATLITNTTRHFLGVILNGNGLPSLSATTRSYVLANRDVVTAATHKAHGEQADHQDRVGIYVDTNRVGMFDGYNQYGHLAADNLARELLFEDLSVAVQAELARQRVDLSKRSGTCFMHATIGEDENGKYVDPAQAGDVHMLVADENNRLAWESQDENYAAEKARSGRITADEALYHSERSDVTNAVGIGAKGQLRYRGATISPRMRLQSGWKVMLYTDGIGDNLTSDEILLSTRGMSPIDTIQWIDATVTKRMVNKGVILAGTPDRKKAGRYVDGFKTEPKVDNMGIAIIDVA